MSQMPCADPLIDKSGRVRLRDIQVCQLLNPRS